MLCGSVRVQLFMPACYDTAPPRASLPRRQRGPFALSCSLHAPCLVSVCIGQRNTRAFANAFANAPRLQTGVYKAALANANANGPFGKPPLAIAFANGRSQSRASKRKRKRAVCYFFLANAAPWVHRLSLLPPKSCIFGNENPTYARVVF